MRLVWGTPVPQKLPSPALVGHRRLSTSIPVADLMLSRAASRTSLMGAALKVLAYEDLDKSGSATPDEAQFSTADRATVDLTADVAGLTLDCSKALPSPAPIQAPMPGIEGAAPPDDPEAAPATDGPPVPPPGPGDGPAAGDAPPAPPPGEAGAGEMNPEGE